MKVFERLLNATLGAGYLICSIKIYINEIANSTYFIFLFRLGDNDRMFVPQRHFHSGHFK